jgi:hypothetical protein
MGGNTKRSSIDTKNRNSVNINQPRLAAQLRPRPRIISNNIRNRRCSFCRQLNHTITYCNDSRLQDFKYLCDYQKMRFERTQIPNPKDEFKSFVIGYYLENPQIVKAFSIRNCGSTTRTDIPTIVDTITNYFYDEFYDLPELIDANDDYIPFPNISEQDENNALDFLIDFMYYQNIFTNRGTHLNTQPLITIHSHVIEDSLKENITDCEECECNICYNSFDNKNFVKLNCSHEFCKSCIISILKTRNYEGPKCAFCRTNIDCLTYRSHEVKKEFSCVINETTNSLI